MAVAIFTAMKLVNAHFRVYWARPKNPVRRDTTRVNSSPTNNPGKFDLWIDVGAKKQLVKLGNWWIDVKLKTRRVTIGNWQAAEY